MTSGPYDWRSIVALNAVSTIAQVGQFGIPFMVLPLWLEQHGASNLELSLFASSLWVGQLPGMHWAPRMTDRFGAIVLKNSPEACFWPMVCMRFVIDGGAHHDGSNGFAGSALLRFQSL
jgi:hypothetical protein